MSRALSAPALPAPKIQPPALLAALALLLGTGAIGAAVSPRDRKSVV